MKRFLAPALAFSVLSAAAIGFLYAKHWESDFLSFYAGARLAGSADLYSVARVHALEAVYERHPAEVRAYIRPPFYAAALWPLGKLPYRQAAVVWQILNAAALVGFVMLWMPEAPAYVLVCTSVPVFINLLVGQDMPIFLFLTAAAMRLIARKWVFVAGLLMALCAAKFHLFVLLPMFVLSKRMWRFGAGLAVGGLGLAAVSFAAAGPNWASRYVALIELNEANQASQSYMPNLNGVFHNAPLPWLWMALFSLLVVAGTWTALKRAALPEALALTLFGGVVIGLHSFMYDLGFLLPWLLLRDTRSYFQMGALLGVTCWVLSMPSVAWAGGLAVFSVLMWALMNRSMAGMEPVPVAARCP